MLSTGIVLFNLVWSCYGVARHGNVKTRLVTVGHSSVLFCAGTAQFGMVRCGTGIAW